MQGLAESDVRVRFIGMRHRVPARLRRLMVELETRTAHCRGLNLSIAIDYGGRDELTRAVQAIAGQVATGEIAPEAICADTVADALDTRALPDPDLIIRTSGEFRVSNFLLWQAVYAEFDFPAVAWPDFTVARFRRGDRRLPRPQPAVRRDRTPPRRGPRTLRAMLAAYAKRTCRLRAAR